MKREREKRSLESEPDIRIKKTQNRTNYVGARRIKAEEKYRTCELKVLEAKQILVRVGTEQSQYGKLAKVAWAEGLRSCKEKKT